MNDIFIDALNIGKPFISFIENFKALSWKVSVDDLPGF